MLTHYLLHMLAQHNPQFENPSVSNGQHFPDLTAKNVFRHIHHTHPLKHLPSRTLPETNSCTPSLAENTFVVIIIITITTRKTAIAIVGRALLTPPIPLPEHITDPRYIKERWSKYRTHGCHFGLTTT